MKRSHALGLAAGLGGSLFLASLAPVPAHTQPTVNGCPEIDFGADAYFDNTPATKTLSNLGAFAMGVVATKCIQGEVTAAAVDGETTLTWRSHYADLANHDAPVRSTYTVSVTAPTAPSGAISPTEITNFGIQEYVSNNNQGSTVAEVNATRVWSGWITEVTQPADGDAYNFTGNTGASIAKQQAGDVAELGKGIIIDALEGDVIGNYQRG